MAEKLADLRQTMAQEGADVHVLTALDDVSWLYNIRGRDIAYNPGMRFILYLILLLLQKTTTI